MRDKFPYPRVPFSAVVHLNTDRVADPAAAGIERYVGIEHITPEDLRVRRWGLVAEGTTFTNHFRPGQVLFPKRRAYQRKVAVADFEGVCSGDIYVFESRDPAVLLPELLPFICQTDAFFDHAIGTSAGSLSPRTNWSHLAAYEFPLPPPDEQRRLVEVLWAIEEAIVAAQVLGQKTDALRKASLIDVFSQLENDADVKWVAVASVGDVLMGRQRAPQYDKGISPRPYLRVANVYDGYIDTTDVKEMDFSDAEFEQYRLQPGDILLNEGQSRELTGRSAIYFNEVTDCCFQNTLIRFRPRRISSAYAHRYFQHCLYSGRFIAISKQTTSIAHLGVTRFAQMRFPFVEEKRQAKITDTFAIYDQGIKAASQRVKRNQQLKRFILDYELSKHGELTHS